ncbi:hypothetical protein CIT37_41260 [Bradyrhizobium ottawaense]|uniref:hypothetical protein n=1 Tax=Bradyrhizobium ottawaense TaxID=931866 RepID=UPI0012600F82|nr:hypothetical protein [Bradyrhizobium ottawaense]
MSGTIDPPEQPPAAPDLSNFDRLQSYLKPDTLAAALLDAWRTSPHDQAKERMLSAMKDHAAKKASQDEAPHSTD